jgi:hypothetical protein
MKSSLALCAVMFLSMATLALAHRLDEYLQATTFVVNGDHVEVQMRLTPGVEVFDRVLAAIDANGDGLISEAEQRAYAKQVSRARTIISTQFLCISSIVLSPVIRIFMSPLKAEIMTSLFTRWTIPRLAFVCPLRRPVLGQGSSDGWIRRVADRSLRHFSITGFTISSLAMIISCLSLAAFNLVSLPQWVVEPLISASIVFVALQNVFWRSRATGWSRLGAAIFFGLFHGLGFAGGLFEAMREMQTGTMLLAILAFSIGIEFGHQMVVIPLFGS